MNDSSSHIPPGKFVGIGTAAAGASEPPPPTQTSDGFPVWGIFTIAAVVLVALVAVAMSLKKKRAPVA